MKSKKEEIILLEMFVKLENDKNDTLLTITEKNIYFEQKKGIIKKKYKRVKSISIDNIKIIKDKVKIEHDKNKVTIYTKNDKISFTCSNLIDTAKVTELITKQRLGSGFLERLSKKGIKILNITKNTAMILGGTAIAAKGAKEAIKNNKGAIKDVVKGVIRIIKK